VSRWLLAVLSGVLATAAPAFAQYHFDSWTTDNGLPQNTVTAIRQTRDGYLWVASDPHP
jgi:ligand-binding sensor domain-containing protein